MTQQSGLKAMINSPIKKQFKRNSCVPQTQEQAVYHMPQIQLHMNGRPGDKIPFVQNGFLEHKTKF